MNIDLPNHYIYGDTMWISGEVTNKHKEGTYFAVKVNLTGTNQIGEIVLTGSAIVYLPSPGHSVSLPLQY